MGIGICHSVVAHRQIIQLTQHLGRVDFLAPFMQIFMNFCCNIPFGILLALD